MKNKERVLYLAGGCFWGVEAYFKKVPGVITTEVGYANGDKANPTYQEVKSHQTTHAETLKLTYDSSILGIEKILEHFLRFVDPYSIDKQGEDEGHQYRSGIYYTDKKDGKRVSYYLRKKCGKKHKIEVLPLDNFYPAEEYHQDYLTKNPDGYCHVNLNLVNKKSRSLFKMLLPHIISISVLVVILIVFSILKNNVDIAESWTRGFSRFYYSIFSVLDKYIPFSLTEILFILLFAFAIFLIVLIIRYFKLREWKKALCKFGVMLSTILSVVCIYTLCCEMAYNRQNIDLPYHEEEVDNSIFKDIYNHFATDLNYCTSQLHFNDEGDIVDEYSLIDLSNKVHESFKKNINSDYFFSSESTAKPMMSSFIYRELNITGVTFAPFAEPNVDYLATKLELPMTVAHEIAHTKGVMREDEANQFAFYICLNSDDPYLRFSAYALYFYQLNLMTSTSYISEEDQAELIDINPNYYRARRYASEYWKKYNLLERIGDFINSLYIKSSGVPSGTSSYSEGSEIDTDPVTLKLIPSKYQKIFFENYFRTK